MAEQFFRLVKLIKKLFIDCMLVCKQRFFVSIEDTLDLLDTMIFSLPENLTLIAQLHH
jgi:hypothetical protein